MSETTAPPRSSAEKPKESAGQTGSDPYDPRAARVRAALFAYDVLILGVLIALAVLYFRARVIAVVLPPELRGLPAYTAWFGVLGSVSISLKGISAWPPTARHWGGRWPLWYLARPFTGLIVGIMTYTLLRAVYTSGRPTAPFFEAAAFILGTQEARFFTFLTAIAKLVLNIPDSGAGGKPANQ